MSRGDSMRACPICGFRRRVRTGRSTTCQPCRGLTITKPVTDHHALTGGRWVTRGAIKVWIRDDRSEVA